MIEPLPIAFKARERIYRQLARKGIVALYEVRNLHHFLIGFEVILVRYQKASQRDTWKYPERERYPNDEEFGRFAWSLPKASLPTAELIFDHLATTMARNRSECVCRKDFYRIEGHHSGSHFRRHSVYRFLTGRRLPKTAHKNEVKKSERPKRTTIEPQSSHNEDSPQ